MPDLIIDAVSHAYGRDHVALREVSLRLERGILGLVGPNGAGKTTLLRILATLLVPSAGAVTWDGRDIARQPEALRRVLGYVPQDCGVYPQLTAREFLTYLGELKLLRGALLRRRVAEALAATHLERHADARLGTFSGGMVRRLGIAQALLAEPLLLVLDEPTVGLDPAERAHLRQLLAALPGDRLVVFSTHIITDVEAMATDLALLRDGRLAWTGTPAALLADAAGSVWTATVAAADYERLRATHQLSAAVRHADAVEVRIIAPERPHPSAIPATPTLEDAYLLFAREAAGEEAAVPATR
ncbi:MAG TPA: ATP-binding cassette domain-containing protein [Ktedonobacterales bacterium]|nr:ATP-binding cassette domain-containing protein [Ktedonobacterales bacterium]